MELSRGLCYPKSEFKAVCASFTQEGWFKSRRTCQHLLFVYSITSRVRLSSLVIPYEIFIWPYWINSKTGTADNLSFALLWKRLNTSETRRHEACVKFVHKMRCDNQVGTNPLADVFHRVSRVRDCGYGFRFERRNTTHANTERFSNFITVKYYWILLINFNF